ncbi:type I restriction-modification system subunit M N-terminal domain-containing protein [Rhodovulum steppense]|uniref:HsdM-like protein n=1 Tax=Rhodovulum steppense TaxID=540251 RepID=A0A4R1YZE5_9RHOB|nr:type I restriction-modification system subunit M N-terminal domain-containing protein [Rhodovulum steppense]TCM86527.1 HsdM-like protein [Rhodovulum steppense]
MAIRKSDIYRSLWESCDQFRGGMDASLCKDYVLTLLFVKYVSDRAGQPDALIGVLPGVSFSEMKALWDSKTIGAGGIAGAVDLALGPFGIPPRSASVARM